MMILSEAANAALGKCYATRGKHKGRLLAQCPRSSTLEAAAWQAAMLVCNPYKCGIATMLFMNDEQRAVHKEVLAFFEQLPRATIVASDRDRLVLESLRVW